MLHSQSKGRKVAQPKIRRKGEFFHEKWSQRKNKGSDKKYPTMVLTDTYFLSSQSSPKSIGRYTYPSCAQPSSCSSPLYQFFHFNLIAWRPSPLLLIRLTLTPFNLFQSHLLLLPSPIRISHNYVATVTAPSPSHIFLLTLGRRSNKTNICTPPPAPTSLESILN